MRELSVRELGDVLCGDLAAAAPGDADLRVTDVSVHSDRLRRGSVFFALPGSRVDGHEFVGRALSNGAVAAVVARDRAGDLAGAGPLIVVDDPLDALQRLAAWWRSHLDGEVVAVVGANGKTITKDALVYFAGLCSNVVGSPGSYNSQLGVALSVLSFPADAEVAVVEAAAVEPGAMARLERIVRPTHVVCTNLGARYESLFPDRRARAAELLTMAKGLGPDAWLLLGEADPDLLAVAAELPCRLHVLGQDGRAPLAFAPAAQDFGAMTTTASFPGGGRVRLRVTHPSQAVLDDVALALTASWLLDPTIGQRLGGSVDYQPTSPETTVWQSPEGVTIVREPASSDPIALTAGLRTARSLVRDGGRMVVVLADPLDGTPGEACAPLGDALADEPPDDLVGLAVPTHEQIVARLRERLPGADGGLDVSLHESMPSLQAELLEELRYGDVVLVQSPRAAGRADPVAHLVDRMAPSRLHVDLTAIESNVAAFRRLLGPEVAITAIVKALAYGTNAVFMGSFLSQAGVDYLAVSSADEGVALRRGGVSVPILVLLLTPGEIEKAWRHRLIPVVYSHALLDAVCQGPGDGDEKVVHVEVDTGMHRTGLDPDEAIEALRRLAAAPHVRVDGLMTHLACADDPDEDEFTRAQLAEFERVVRAAREMGLRGVVAHAAATAAAVRIPEARMEMVRLGLGLYGIHVSRVSEPLLPLDPAVAFISRIVHTYSLEEGDRVGYGGLYRAPAGGRRVAIVPVGYHDGVSRSFRGGTVLVHGRPCEVIGAISMDSMAIDITAAPEAEVGSDVLIFGSYGGATVDIHDFAEMMGTIPHEVLATIGPRVQRVFSRH